MKTRINIMISLLIILIKESQQVLNILQLKKLIVFVYTSWNSSMITVAIFTLH